MPVVGPATARRRLQMALGPRLAAPRRSFLRPLPLRPLLLLLLLLLSPSRAVGHRGGGQSRGGRRGSGGADTARPLLSPPLPAAHFGFTSPPGRGAPGQARPSSGAGGAAGPDSAPSATAARAAASPPAAPPRVRLGVRGGPAQALPQPVVSGSEAAGRPRRAVYRSPPAPFPGIKNNVWTVAPSKHRY